jgi:hypothetical protein
MATLSFVASFVRDVFSRTTSTSSPNLDGRWFSRKDQGFIALEAGESAAYAGVVSRLAREYGKAGDISTKTLATFVQDVLFATLDLQAATQDVQACECRLKAAMGELHRKLTDPAVPYCCFLPVQGLSAEGLPMTLGRARLIVMTEARMRRLVLPRDAGLTAADRKERRRILPTLSNECLIGQPVAQVTVLARDADAARALALEETRAVVDVLNFFADLVPSHPAWLYLAGEAGRETTSAVLACANGSLTLHNSLEGPVAPYSIERLKSVRSLRLARTRIHALSREDPPSEVSRLLLTSIGWAGRASVEPVPARALVQYMIALEALFLPTGSRLAMKQLQTRVSRLLGKTAQDREWHYDRVGELYELRSSVVHDGSSNVSPEDLGAVRSIAKRSLLLMLRHRGIRNVHARAELARWLDTR